MPIATSPNPILDLLIMDFHLSFSPLRLRSLSPDSPRYPPRLVDFPPFHLPRSRSPPPALTSPEFHFYPDLPLRFTHSPSTIISTSDIFH